MNKILIAIPTFENILPDTFKSVYNLEVPEGTSCYFEFINGYGCAKARNDIAKLALEQQYTYVMMVDSDIILPSNALVSMYSAQLDICLGVYPRKNTSTSQTEIFKLGQDNFVEVYTAEQIDALNGMKAEIKGGGLGCSLIRTDIFSTLVFPWFKYVEYNNGETLSEDNYFCNLAASAGYKIYVDSAVRCGHSIRGFQWR